MSYPTPVARLERGSLQRAQGSLCKAGHEGRTVRSTGAAPRKVPHSPSLKSATVPYFLHQECLSQVVLGVQGKVLSLLMGWWQIRVVRATVRTVALNGALL